MRGGVIILLFLLPAALNAAQVLAPSSPLPASGILRWKNGESLHGDIAAASASDITWKTPLFEDPLQLHWNVVDRIDWPSPPVQATGPFSIALRDGSFIYGDVASIGADSISIHSTRHGDAVLKRSEVLSIRRLPHGSLLYSGPMGDVGWQLMSSQQDGSLAKNLFAPGLTPSLMTGPDGALLIRSWNRSGQLDITLPDSVDVEFRVHSSKRPQFCVALGGNINESLRVATWDNELMLVAGNQFKIIRKIEESEREVGLRVCWDKKAQKCLVLTPAGELIIAWQVPGNPPGSSPGLVLQNSGLDLSLDFLRVRAWNGKPPPRINPKSPHVELADGRSVAGEISVGAPGSIHLQTPGQTVAADFPLVDVDALVFSSDLPQVASHEATLLYNDGTILWGSVASVSNGHAAIATSFTKEPLSSQLDLVRQLLIRLPVSEGTGSKGKALTDQDKILIEQTTLHGKLESAEDNSPGWIPVGGLKASRPSKSFSSEITRFVPPDTPTPNDPALFYLSSGDVLSGNLRSLDRSGAEFESNLMEVRKLPAEELNAIEFNAPTRLNVQGFGDPGWQIVKGNEKTVRRNDDGIQMDPGTIIAYPSLMQSNEISFKYVSNGFSSVRFRMFCSRADSSHSTNLLFGNTGNQFISGLESTPGQFDNQVQVRTQPGNPVAVRLKIEENQMELFVNDISTQHFPIDPAKRAGSGLIIEPASLWGNGINPVALSGFSAHSGPGRTWLPDVDDEIKTQVLTVPRFQKDDPPRHLLLAANGDVLRGEIEAATATHLGFRCGLETLDVPRDRVRAVIWLKPPEANPATTAPAEKPAPNPLDQRIGGRIMFNQAGLSQLISFMKGQVPGLKFSLPEKEDPRKIQMLFCAQTVSEALAVICSRFDLHYRQISDGTIILESATLQSTSDLALKTYWLKPDAIPKAPSAQEILMTKGITFPEGSSAQWQPNGGLLSMVNTAENQTKLAALLNSDFGGSLGSPTHWLQLTNGARLALAVDKIGQDFITGHHPVYGSVKVPMAQVYVIRSTPPAPSATIKSLENWCLVNAPEPVLPEGSGEISPLLGKEASTFKLPLLEGGDFNLDEQKGQIVVLDFWASWCGPCIKSLPGLIDTIASFPADRVKLIGVNQGEAPAQVKNFLKTRGLKFAVAMDADQNVARKYGVDSIPHTVIVGPDGKVAWVQTGYSPGGDTEAADTVKRLLGTSSPASSPAAKSTQ